VPPALPTRLTDPNRPVIIGTVLWFLAFVGMLIARLGYHAGTPLMLWTTLAGWVLGLIGLGILHWQSVAASRGSRSAQRVPN
jgi:protein-S-isoprenylcysteine O-methyltransferase Ste14